MGTIIPSSKRRKGMMYKLMARRDRILAITLSNTTVHANTKAKPEYKPIQYEIQVNNGNPDLNLNIDAINIDSKTYMEINSFASVIDWDINPMDAKMELRSKAGDKRVDLFTKENVLSSGHITTPLGMEVTYVEDRLYIPLKEVAERCSWQVEWDNDQAKVTMTSKEKIKMDKGENYKIYKNINPYYGNIIVRDLETQRLDAANYLFEVVGKELETNPDYIEFELNGKRYVTEKSNLEVDQVRRVISEHYRSDELTRRMEEVINSGETCRYYNYDGNYDNLGPNVYKTVGGQTNSQVAERLKEKVDINSDFDTKMNNLIDALKSENLDYDRDAGDYHNIDMGNINCRSVTALLREVLDTIDIEYRVVMTRVEGERISHVYLEVKDDNGFWRELDGTKYYNNYPSPMTDTIKTESPRPIKERKLTYVSESALVMRNENPTGKTISIKTPSIKNGEIVDKTLVSIEYPMYGKYLTDRM